MANASLVRDTRAVRKRLNSLLSLYSLKLLPAHLSRWQETSIEQQLHWRQGTDTEVWRWWHLHSLAQWQLRGGCDRVDIDFTRKMSDSLAFLKEGNKKRQKEIDTSRRNMTEPLRKGPLLGCMTWSRGFRNQDSNVPKERGRPQFESQLHHFKDIWPHTDCFIFLILNVLIFNMEIVLLALPMSQSCEGLMS